MNPIVAAIEACQTASEVFEALNRFFVWSRKTRSDFFAYGPLPIQSAREIVAWKSGLRAAAKVRHAQNEVSMTCPTLPKCWPRRGANSGPW